MIPFMSTADLVARRDALLGKGAPLFYETPLHIVRGEGVWLYDDAGHRYVDMYNNVPCVGHANAHVVEAMRRQASTLNVHSRYLHAGVLDFAERYLALHAAPIDRVVFACTGTEANEVAMQMARIATGGTGFICTDGAYHGNSVEVGRLTHAPRRGRDGVHAIPFPQRYRPIEPGLSEAALEARYLAEVQAAIDDFAAQGVKLAGMLVCPILANEGLPGIPGDFMARAAQLIRQAGGVFIVDEVQAGYCRTGRWWGYQAMNVVPDIVTTGKPMGNGLPLAACAARADIVDAFRAQTRYFNTFAASPLQAAVGMAVLDVIESERLLERVADVGAYLRAALREMQGTCQAMGDVRGHGLFVGVDWVKRPDTREPDRDGAVRVVNRLKDKGFLTSNAGALRNVVKIRPPLVFERSHADLFLEAFRETLHEVHG